jgi:capsular exopolysaccharide synthesis family protein
MILIILLVFIGVAVGGTLAWLRTAPLYTVEALLEVLPPDEGPLASGMRSYNKDWLERIMTTQASMVKSTRVLRQASQNENLQMTDWFRELNKQVVPQELDEEVSVSPHPNSNLLKVSMTGFRKEELPVIVDAVALAAVAYSTTAEGSATGEKIANLKAERDELSTRLEDKRSQIRAKRSQAQAGDVIERRETLLLELRDVVPMKNQLEIERDSAKQALEIMEQQRQQGILETSPEVLDRIERDPRIQSLRTAEMNAATQLENLHRKLGPRHRDVEAAESRLKAIREKIESVKKEIVDTEVAALVELRNRELQMIIKRLGQVMEKYRQINSNLRSAQQKIDELETIEAEAEALETNIERINQRLMELRVAESAARPMRLVQPATEPDQPSAPKWQIMIPLGVVLGLVVGVGLAVLLEFVDTSVQSPADISSRIDLPMLGMVPHSDDVDEDLGDLRCAMLKSKGGLVAESFREIRTNLQFSGPIEQHRTLLVTSSSPGDGRTTVAVNLAATMAQAGRKVLLVDANFRQPAVAQLFPQVPEGGLSSALVGQGDWREQVSEVEPNLTVMGAGPLPPNPSDLLGSDEMKRIADEMAGEYDQVIFDGAPCLVVTDPVVMSSQVAGVLLVVRAGSNTHGIVTRVRNSLQRVGAHVTGAVLNGVRATSGGYLRKNYETFYEYHENPKLPM